MVIKGYTLPFVEQSISRASRYGESMHLCILRGKETRAKK
jgi:hypothetical protein